MPETKPILVPVSSVEDAHVLKPLWVALARDGNHPVLFVHVVLPDEPWHVAREEGNQLLEQVHALAKAEGVAAETRLATGYTVADALQDVIREVQPALLLLRWEQTPRKERPAYLGRTIDPLLDRPLCDVLVVRGDLSAPDSWRILVPTAGGPNAGLAAQVARGLAHAYGGSVTLLYVHRDAGPPPPEFLARLAGDLASDPLVETRAIQAAGVVQGIVEAAKDFDLLLVGATEESFWRRVRVGDVPRRLAAEIALPLVIAKRATPRGRRWVWTALEAVDQRLPKLSAAERAEVYRALRDHTRAGGGFLYRMALAGFIAALGLLLDSPAIVIGAMLVAPLMAAVLAIGLGIVTGNPRLVRQALLRVLQGAFVVLAISALTVWVDPLAQVTREIAARTRPTLLDLGVALASGAAGGYAVSRKEVQEALPGVAIAVALVPPLSVVGIALALQEWRIALGATLLYLVNAVSIAGAGGLTFLALGFRPHVWSRTRLRVFWRGVIGLLILLASIALPLAWITQRDIREGRVEQSLQQAIMAHLQEVPSFTLHDLSWSETRDGALEVVVYLEGQKPLAPESGYQLQQRLEHTLGRRIWLRVVWWPAQEFGDRHDPPRHNP